MRQYAASEIFPAHSRSVIGYPYGSYAAVFDGNIDFFGAGVDTVLDKLLDDARGSLDDFTGGDPIIYLRLPIVYLGYFLTSF